MTTTAFFKALSRQSLKFLLLITFALICVFIQADIAIYGDTQDQEDIHRGIIGSIVTHSPGIAFHTGDLTLRGSNQKHYDTFFAISKPLLEICPIHPAKGNHDRSRELFLANFPDIGNQTYYSVEHDSLLFIILDSTLGLKPRSGQYEWLQKMLRSEGCRAKIVILHHPILSSGYEPGESGLELFLPSMFEDTGVVAVFSGHHHNYERLEYKGITYFITGGGGGKLLTEHHPRPESKALRIAHNYIILSRRGNELTCTAHGLEGQVLDSCVIALP
ncbi:MAG: metallophosphoesterase family protein [Candidatus Syntrophosphaera sp.]